MSEPIDAATRVARVAVDIPLAHLDRLFDYTIPAEMDDAVVQGAKVRVRFAGQLRDGWIVEFGKANPTMQLKALQSVVSSEPIMTPHYFGLLRAVADHYAGVVAEVIRLAIPPRHASTEKSAATTWPEPKRYRSREVLPAFDTGMGFCSALEQGRAVRAVWLAPSVAAPIGDITEGLLEATDACLSSGKHVIVVVATARELEAVTKRFHAAFGKSSVAVFSSELGPSARYRNFLAVARGIAKIVVGTRTAALAPMPNLGLIAVVDDGNDSHSDPRSPYPHSREIAVLRARHDGCAVLLAAHARSTEAQAYLARGWAGELRLSPASARRVSPLVRVVGDDPSREPTAARLRLPTEAFSFLRNRLLEGPVLIQVPLTGHSIGLRCRRCRNRALCPSCSGPLRARRRDELECALCGFEPARWQCPHCAGLTLRAPIAGAVRTAEELARAFPGTQAINSSDQHIRSAVRDHPAIVVATPGAEPVATNGYAGVMLLDTEIMLTRPDLRVEEETLRRWSNAIALCRGPERGGTVVAVGDPSSPALQALVRWDIPALIQGQLEQREVSGLPPAVRVVQLSGDSTAVTSFIASGEFSHTEIIGPTFSGAGDQQQAKALLRAPLEAGRELMMHVKAAAAIRSARKTGGKLSIHTDPQEMD